MLDPRAARHAWLAGLLAGSLGPRGLEMELQRLQRAGLLPADGPSPRSWSDALSTLPPAARAALILRVCPAQPAADEALFLDRVAATLLCSTLEPFAMLDLAIAARLVPEAPSVDGVGDWARALVRQAGVAPVSQDGFQALSALLGALDAALPADEARALGLPALTAAWSRHLLAWGQRRAAQDQADRSALRALLGSMADIRALLTEILTRMGALSRPSLSISGGTFQGVNIIAGGDQREATITASRGLAQDLDELEALSRRWSPWGWLVAARRLLGLAGAALDPHQADQFLETGARLRVRLVGLARWGPPAYALLWLLSLGVPLNVLGVFSAPPLLWLLRALRPVALMVGLFTAGVGVTIEVVSALDRAVEEQARGAVEVVEPPQRFIDLIVEAPRPVAPPEVELSPARKAAIEETRERVAGEEAKRPPLKTAKTPPPKTATQPPVKDEEPPPVAPPPVTDHPVDAATVLGQVLTANATLPDSGPPLQPVGSPPTGGTTGEDHTTRIGGLRFIGLTGGEFDMGSPESDPDAGGDEKPQHRVRVGAYFIGEREVTQAAWRAVVLAAKAEPQRFPEAAKLDPDPSNFKGDDLPVEKVSWCDALRFANVLSVLDGLERAVVVPDDCGEDGAGPVTLTGKSGYRLPTEVEWEHAARAGTITRYWSGDGVEDLKRVGWVGDNSGSQTHPTCAKGANAWGLCDVHGNVWEWTLDPYARDAYAGRKDGMLADPGSARYTALGQQNTTKSAISADSDALRVARGGSWLNGSDGARSAFRDFRYPWFRSDLIGFRLVLPAAPPGR